MDGDIIEIDCDEMEIDDKSTITILELPGTSETCTDLKILPTEKLMIIPLADDKTESASTVEVEEKPAVEPEMKSPTKAKRKKPVRKPNKKGLKEEIGYRNAEPDLSFYARQKLIPLLQNTHPLGNPDDKYNLTINLNYSDTQSDKVVEYIECQAKHGEENSEKDSNVESFLRINDWIRFLREKNMNDICGNEVPLLFKLIANLETHPKPEEIDGINLEELYKFISNIMLGYPTTTPTGKTGKFLQETFKSIIGEMDFVAEDMVPFKQQLKRSTLFMGPDATDNFNLEELRLILCNSSTNPFNLPFEFLNLNHYGDKFCTTEGNK